MLHEPEKNSNGKRSLESPTVTQRPEITEDVLAKWQHIVDLMASIIQVPAGLIMRVHTSEIEVFVTSATQGNPYKRGDREHLNIGLYCETVMEQRAELLVPDALKDSDWDHNPDIKLNMISYLGYPLRWPDEDMFGTICILDNKANAYSELYRELMQQFQAIVETDLRLLYEIYTRKQIEEELMRHRDHLEEMVAEHTIELQAAHDRLLELGRVKDEFISSISHELRTPITNLKLQQRLLESHPGTIDQRLKIIQNETDRLQSIIEDVLFLANLNREETKLDLTTVNLHILVSKLFAERRTLAAESGITLKYTASTASPLVQGDRALLDRAVNALLSNAINYTPEGGQVEVITFTKEADGKQWTGFSVIDNGVGIPLEEQPRIFERFFRGQITLDSGKPGSGLGLATAKQIVERHHGIIEFESAPGRGSVFTVMLPSE